MEFSTFFLSFFLLLMSAVMLSAVFHRFHLPWVLALISTGILIGPYGLQLLELNTTIDFLAELGLVFLMFMAGLATKLSSFKRCGKRVIIFSILNSTIPFIFGVVIGVAFDMSFFQSLLLGLVFMASSVAVVIPTLEAAGISTTPFGKMIISSTVIQDIASLVVLSIILQTVSDGSPLPLPLLYATLLVVLILFRYGLPKLRSLIHAARGDGEDHFESEVRTIFAMMLGTVVVFGALGLHPIMAAFFTGLILSESITNSIVLDKLHTISYGIFIPIFFIIVGARTDISIFYSDGDIAYFMFVLIVGAMCAKVFGGFAAARLARYSETRSLIAGFATVPLLSTALAVVSVAEEHALLDAKTLTAVVGLSIASTLIAPLVLRLLTRTN